MRRRLTLTGIAAALAASTVLVYAAASYPSAVKSFSTKTDGSGQTIFAAHINDLQDEVVAIETALLNGIAHALIPSTNDSVDLGSSSKRWQDGWFSGNLSIKSIDYVWPSADGSANQLLLTNGSKTLSWSAVGPKSGGCTATTASLTDGATPALDASLGCTFRLAAAGDRTIAVPTNPTPSQKIVIEHFASGGARTLALNSGAGGFRFGTDITALTQTASGKTDYIGAIYNDTDTKWDVVAYVKGY